MGWMHARWAVGLGAAALWTLAVVSGGYAAPVSLSMQGTLRSSGGGPVAEGEYGLQVALYDAADAVQPSFVQKFIAVPVAAGLFDVTLGGALPGESLDAALFFGGKAGWVGVQVGNEPELPRVPLRRVPYAVFADEAAVAGGLACSGCVDSAMLAAGSVGGAQIQPFAVAASHVAFPYAGSAIKGGPASAALVADQALKADLAAQTEELACTGCVTLKHLHPDVAGGFLATSGGAVVGDTSLQGTTTLVGTVHLPGGATATTAGVGGLKIAALDTKAAPCTAAQQGQLAIDQSDTALYYCNGSSWRRLAGCEGVCPAASSVMCGAVVVDDCGDPCVPAATGTACPVGQSCSGGQCQAPLGAKLNPATSCLAIKDADPASADGSYWLDVDGDGGVATFEVWCDMTTAGGGWTLLEAYDVAVKEVYNKAPLATLDLPRNEDAHNWDDYRLGAARVGPLLAGATRFHARCHRVTAQSPDDFLFGDIELVQQDFGGYFTKSNGANPHNLSCAVRGYGCNDYDFRWWNIDGSNSWHPGFDVSSTLPAATSSEDSFAWHDGGLNTAHLCHSSAGEVVWMVR